MRAPSPKPAARSASGISFRASSAMSTGSRRWPISSASITSALAPISRSIPAACRATRNGCSWSPPCCAAASPRKKRERSPAAITCASSAARSAERAKSASRFAAGLGPGATGTAYSLRHVRLRSPAAAFRPMVRAPRLDAASAPARAHRGGARRALGAARCTDRRRQDLGGLPPELDRSCRAPAGRTAYALYFAAEGARRRHPPQLLMTTPESLALLISSPEAAQIFAGLSAIIIDELHALAGTKRGDMLALGLARLKRLAPRYRRIGLSATVAWPDDLAAWLRSGGADVARITAAGGARPELRIL